MVSHMATKGERPAVADGCGSHMVAIMAGWAVVTSVGPCGYDRTGMFHAPTIDSRCTDTAQAHELAAVGRGMLARSVSKAAGVCEPPWMGARTESTRN